MKRLFVLCHNVVVRANYSILKQLHAHTKKLIPAHLLRRAGMSFNMAGQKMVLGLLSYACLPHEGQK